MTRDDIIRMAMEIGGIDKPEPDSPGVVFLERFAALVAAAEREKVAQWMIQRSYATGHGDTTEDLLNELEWQVRESEREACAALIDANAVVCLNNSMLADVLAGNAMAIRARSKT